jgi:hypothetical protein
MRPDRLQSDERVSRVAGSCVDGGKETLSGAMSSSSDENAELRRPKANHSQPLSPMTLTNFLEWEMRLSAAINAPLSEHELDG